MTFPEVTWASPAERRRVSCRIFGMSEATEGTAETKAPQQVESPDNWFWMPQSKPRRVLRVAWRIVRLAAFVAILFWGAGFLSDDANRVCSTVTRTGFEAATTETCSAPGLDSPITLGLLLFAVLLLWPDLSEVGVLGITLKRQVAEAVVSAKKAEQAATSLSAQVSQWILTSSTSSASTNTEFNVYTSADANTVTRAAEGTERSRDLNAETAALKDASEDELVGKVVRKWAELQEVLELDNRLRPKLDDSTERASRLTGARLDIVGKWNDELFALRRLRNAAAHGADLERARLEDGVVLLDSLLEEYRELAERVTGEFSDR